jgi:hypothetical protein
MSMEEKYFYVPAPRRFNSNGGGGVSAYLA